MQPCGWACSTTTLIPDRIIESHKTDVSYPSYDHGMVSYLTKEEDNRMTLLSYSAVIICAGGAILEGIRNWQGRKP